MSQGGEVTTQQLVYGPDGKVYGNPAQARAAGVNQYYREDGTPYPTSNVGIQSPTLPPDFIPLPGPDFPPMPRQAVGGATPALPPDFIPLPGPVVSPMPNPPSGGKGGADPYSQIMGQMGYGSDPYSQIMSQMSVRQNPYAYSPGGAIGGYDPSLYNNAFMGSNSRLNLSGLLGGGGGGGGGGSEPAAPSDWSNKTDAERAAYYSANPFMASVTQLGQKALGFTSLGALAKAMNPDLYNREGLITMGVNPAAYQAAKEGFRASEIADMNAAAEAAANAAMNAQSMQSMQDALAADTAAAQAQSVSDQNTGGDGGGYGGYSDGGGSSSFGEGQYNMGGLVDRVGGPNPPGPDDGTGMLQLGEYVIKKSSVKKYGQGLLDMINDGKIPAKKIKSLLG